MNKLLVGKYLVRKVKLENNKDAIVLTGIFNPSNFNIDEIDDLDEMWVSGIIINNGLRFSGNKTPDISPEDFLNGKGQLTDNWKNKEKL